MKKRASLVIKDQNRQLILENITKNSNVSRSDLSKITGLNKVTTSSQVQSLLHENILVESQAAQSRGGRKPIILNLNAEAAFFLGIDLDRDYFNLLLSDLTGKVHYQDIIKIHSHSFDEVCSLIIRTVNSLFELPKVKSSSYGLVSMTVGVHGIVQRDQIVAFTPQHSWQNVNLKQVLEDELPLEVTVDNNTNLCAYAEYVCRKETVNLISISTYSGIGMGVIQENKFFRGHHGFAGEVGHMIIEPEGKKCSCGNSGCWELYASEKALMDDIKVLKQLQEVDWELIEELCIQNDPVILKKLDNHIRYLALGLNNILNIYNPETLIINTGFKSLFSDFEIKIKSNLTSKMNHFERLEVSKLGKNACSIGACALGIRKFLDIEDLYINPEHYKEKTLVTP